MRLGKCSLSAILGGLLVKVKLLQWRLQIRYNLIILLGGQLQSYRRSKSEYFIRTGT